MVKALERFSKQYDGCHIAITCRIAATEYTFESAFTYLELADFAPEQVETFVRNWFWDKAKPEGSARLAEQMLTEWKRAEHEGIRDLTRNPLLLALLCLTYEETLSFPSRRVEIYEEALGALLKKWDATRGIRRKSLYGRLSTGRKEEMFARIAYDAFVAGEILFEQRDLEARLKAYLVHVPEMPEPVDIDAEEVLREIVAQHGIFAEQAHRLFSFAHLTFQEYYAARYIWESADAGTLEVLTDRMGDEKWREVFLLTASRLPDATRFLILFEGVLRDLVVRRPRLASWLRWIDERTAASQASYRLPSTRLYYVVVGARSQTDRAPRDFILLIRDCDRALHRAIELEDALDLDRDFTLGRDFAFARDLARRLTRERGRVGLWAEGLNRAMKRLLDRCQQLGQVELYESLTALAVPTANAPPEMWEELWSQFRMATEDQSTLQCYLQLEAEAKKVDGENRKRWAEFDAEDWKALSAYLQGTGLFYDCLQLAYTPDREEFEERILAPPL
jgi:hypothetical protein